MKLDQVKGADVVCICNLKARKLTLPLPLTLTSTHILTPTLTLTRTLTPTLTRTLSRTLTPTFAPTLTPALTSPCCPLQARKLAGIASDGMVLCASDAAKTSLAFVLPPARTHRPHPIPPTPYHPPHTTTLSHHPVPPTPSHHPLGSHAPSPDRPTHPCPAQAGSKPGDRVAWAGYEGEPETPKQMDKKKAPS